MIMLDIVLKATGILRREVARKRSNRSRVRRFIHASMLYNLEYVKSSLKTTMTFLIMPFGLAQQLDGS